VERSGAGPRPNNVTGEAMKIATESYASSEDYYVIVDEEKFVIRKSHPHESNVHPISLLYLSAWQKNCKS
jgi:hypothetical protein